MRKPRISRYRLKQLLRCFCADLTATQTAVLTRLNRNTVNRYYRLFRERLADHQEAAHGEFHGVVEMDESYFGPRRERPTRRGRGTAKTPVFGILKRDGRVYTQIIESTGKAQIQAIIRRNVRRGSTVYTNGWLAYDGLVLSGYKHHRVHHEREFARSPRCHINGIENFWSFAKRRLRKFNGIPRSSFHLFLKECEFRYNERRHLERKLQSILEA